MLIHNTRDIGGKLLSIRKKAGLTQSELAEKAGLSDRTYADIERGTVNMRVDKLNKFCNTVCLTPDDIVTEEESAIPPQNDVMDKLNSRSLKEQKTALQLLDVYLKSLE